MKKVLGTCAECGIDLYEYDSVFKEDALYGDGKLFCSEYCVLNYYDVTFSKNDLYLVDDKEELEEFWQVLEYFNLEEIVLEDEDEDEEEEEEEWE
jgi:hypothetical protein